MRRNRRGTRSGVLVWSAAATIALALAACGGAATPAAETSAGAPTEAMVATAEAPTMAPAATEMGMATSASGTATKLNLNTATEEEFKTVPGAGEKMADEFAEYRPWTSILQFRKEIGKYVDEAQVAEFEKYVFVPVKPNDADEATLQQLPGVTAAIAAQLKGMQPFADNTAFLAALGTLVSPTDAAAAAAYLDNG